MDFQCVDRRTALKVAGLTCAGATVAGCATYGAQDNEPAEPVAPVTVDPNAEADPAEAADALASIDDIPVGGGEVFASEQVVVTQPASGTFQAFSAVCTHEGCIVANVSDGTINCSCHGSRFNLDGSVANGPAASGLPPRQISIAGRSIILG
ncbi:ubiquinol-cytochrome c reductase iron-sulfur subunit [Hoyosella altamirensis]|uniref:Cytochrome bc1 complex Rieske iron-sulfur subunit n=1 Tax=Hoyosella altamirensis TaxID=616997 RepID=A0A839RJX3_9ACTN|nr:Rieske (2Fe-2S) protein [Hoyosella altamirensis]MBB3036750.1 Rieske Fe-S protein [Hoyosella altamirensis]